MKFKYISLFSGAGGLDIGLERAGLEAVSLLEIEPMFCKTLRSNQGWQHEDGFIYLEKAKILQSDVRAIDKKDLLASSDEIDLLVGGPPCQAFSSSGKQLSVLDPRGALVTEFYRLVDTFRPKMFLFENVRGLITARDEKGVPGGVLLELIRILEDLGYSCRAELLNSADFGAYQRRVRCFIVGSRKGEAPKFPTPSFQKGAGLFGQNWQTLGNFLNKKADPNIENHVFPTPALFEALKNLSDGCGLKSKGRPEATRPGGHWGYRQGTFIADLNLPARTVTGSASQDWVRWEGKLRRLTLREVQLLQGFPSDWIIEGPKALQFKQIGNAVPSVFGEALGKMIIEHLQHFPVSAPIRIDVPKSFFGYIEYTKRDHARNHSARSIHHKFQEMA